MMIYIEKYNAEMASREKFGRRCTSLESANNEFYLIMQTSNKELFVLFSNVKEKLLSNTWAYLKLNSVHINFYLNTLTIATRDKNTFCMHQMHLQIQLLPCVAVTSPLRCTCTACAQSRVVGNTQQAPSTTQA